MSIRHVFVAKVIEEQVQLLEDIDTVRATVTRTVAITTTYTDTVTKYTALLVAATHELSTAADN